MTFIVLPVTCHDLSSSSSIPLTLFRQSQRQWSMEKFDLRYSWSWHSGELLLQANASRPIPGRFWHSSRETTMPKQPLSYVDTISKRTRLTFSKFEEVSIKRGVNSKNERTTGELTIWLTIDNCLTVTIDGSKRTNYWLRVFMANNITA